MDLNLKGKRALVTGSTGGIGEAIVRALAQEGVRVVIHGRNELAAELVASRIRSVGGEAAMVLGDLSNDRTASHVAEYALDAFGGLDIVVNNVGVAEEDSWDEPRASVWQDTFNTNTFSTVRLVEHLLPQMRDLEWGRFIQVTSMSGIYPSVNYAAYGASKAALRHLSVSLAKSLAKSGITSNSISPGVIMSPKIRAWIAQMAKDEGWQGTLAEQEAIFTERFMPNLVGRMGRPEEIASLVCYLASPLADFITGAEFAADGGHIG